MPSHSALHILMLDDEAFMLELLGQILTSLGYEQLVYHTNGVEALEAMKMPHGMPDVILLDINMPCMDGVTEREQRRQDKQRRFYCHCSRALVFTKKLCESTGAQDWNSCFCG